MVGLQVLLQIRCVDALDRHFFTAKFTYRFLHVMGLSLIVRLKLEMHPERCRCTWLWNQNLLTLHVISLALLTIRPRREVNSRVSEAATLRAAGAAR